MPRLTNPWTWAAELIDNGYSVQDALRTVADSAVSDLMLEIPAGRTDKSSVNKFGRNPTVATSSTEPIWDGSTTYTWPTSATITHLWSAVDSAITQGVVVEIQGLDTNWAAVTQNATTNASDSTTEVTLTTALRRVFRIKVLDDTATDQILRVGPTGKATHQAQINIGKNQTQMAIYTVPLGKTAYITRYYASQNKVSGGGDPDTNIIMWNRDNANGYAPQLKHTIGMSQSGSSHFSHPFGPYLKVEEKTDIWLEVENLSSTAVADVDAGFDIILE